MSWGNVFSRLSVGADLPSPAQRARPRFNPRPLGVLQPGSAADSILAVLVDCDGAFVPCECIVRESGRTTSSVTHSLVFLRSRGLLEVSEDSRNPRYLRYTLSEQGKAYAASRPSPVAQARPQSMHAVRLEPDEESRLAALRRCWARDLPDSQPTRENAR